MKLLFFFLFCKFYCIHQIWLLDTCLVLLGHQNWPKYLNSQGYEFGPGKLQPRGWGLATYFLILAMIASFLPAPWALQAALQLSLGFSHTGDPCCLPAAFLRVTSISATYSLLVQLGLPLIPWMHLVLDSISPGRPHWMTVHPFILNHSGCLLAWKLMCYWNFIPVDISLCVGKLGITSSFSESFPVSFRRNTKDNCHRLVPVNQGIRATVLIMILYYFISVLFLDVHLKYMLMWIYLYLLILKYCIELRQLYDYTIINQSWEWCFSYLAL